MILEQFEAILWSYLCDFSLTHKFLWIIMLYFKIYIYLMDYSGCSCKNLDHFASTFCNVHILSVWVHSNEYKIKKSIATTKQGWQHITGKTDGSRHISLLWYFIFTDYISVIQSTAKIWWTSKWKRIRNLFIHKVVEKPSKVYTISVDTIYIGVL
jgi:hypothetical protein